MTDDTSIESLIEAYYKNYYKVQLGLPDWHERIQLRIAEENNYCSRFIDYIQEWFHYDFSGKKVLVVGCGTGGELVYFKQKGAYVYGIDPNKDALKICYMKARENDIQKECISQGFSESLSFEDNEFDFIYCFTVLEHVNDIETSIYEMVRCVKDKGMIFIETPDYRQLYEGHYKLPLPMFLPIWFNKIILKIIGRPSDFIGSINKVNSRIFMNIFSRLPVVPIRVYGAGLHEFPKLEFRLSWVVKLIQHLICKIFGITVNQVWILHKSMSN